MSQNRFVKVFSRYFLTGVVSCTLLVGEANASNTEATTGGLGLVKMAPAGSGISALTPGKPVEETSLFAKPSKLDQEAFDRVAHTAMPMTPYQITKLKRMLLVTQQAAATPASTPPKPVTSSIMVSLAPGRTPPVILLQKGFISSLVFVDSTGHVWPVTGFDIGNPNAFNVKASGNNVLFIQAKDMFTYGNLVVKLKGEPTPVILTLVPGQKTVDYRVDIHVEGRSPTAPPLGKSSIPSQPSNTLLNVLNGNPPPGAKTLTVTGGSCRVGLNNCQAWLAGSQLFVRIPMQILSPGWISKMQSSDGMYAYQMTETPSLLVSDYGSTTQLKVEGL
jgi:intracellular multiplication protein IcmK